MLLFCRVMSLIICVFQKAADLVTVNITALVLVGFQVFEMCFMYKITVFQITRAVLPLLLAQGKGHIVNISSDLGKKPSVGAALYGASKTFVDYFSKALDCEYKSHGIRVQVCADFHSNFANNRPTCC